MTDDTIKALPLYQPWASLVALGAKRIETRAYPPGRLGLAAGQRIAIHAAKRTNDLPLCDSEYFRDHLPHWTELPLGAIVATCTLRSAEEITRGFRRYLERVDPQEEAFGYYTPGRWAWFLADVERLAEPVPFRGSQGTFDVPLERLTAAKPVLTLSETPDWFPTAHEAEAEQMRLV